MHATADQLFDTPRCSSYAKPLASVLDGPCRAQELCIGPLQRQTVIVARKVYHVFEKRETKTSAIGNCVPGYDETSERTLGRKRPDLTTMRLCCHLCQTVDYIFVDRSGKKRKLIGEKNTQNHPGERREREFRIGMYSRTNKQSHSLSTWFVASRSEESEVSWAARRY